MKYWNLLPCDVQDRILANYKWSVGFISYEEGTHTEFWDAVHPFLCTRGKYPAGSWRGDPVYEKFLILRPDARITVLDEFFPA
jgi:hypothetical protein